MIMKKSEGLLDISSDSTCQKFTAFYKGFVKTLKKNGKGDTKHRVEIPNHSLVKLNNMLILICDLMATKDKLKMVNLLAGLPPQNRSNFHYLTQWGALYILMSQTAKRGREGLDEFKKEYLEIQTNLETGVRYYKQVINVIDDPGRRSRAVCLRNLTICRSIDF
jgi:hypothetical protein